MGFQLWIKDVKKLDKVPEDDFENLMTLYNEYNEFRDDKMKKLVEGKASKEDIDLAIKEQRESNLEQFKLIKDILKEQGVEMTKRSMAQVERESKSFTEQVKESLELNKEGLSQLKTSKAGGFYFEVKTVADMTFATHVTGEIPQGQREPGINDIAKRRPFIADFIQSGVMTSNLLQWIEKQGQEGAAAGTAEGVAKNQIDFNLVLASEVVVKRTAFIKVSTEMLDDIDFLMSEINNELKTELDLDVDNQCLNGNGTPPNLNGIITQATTFAAGTFALTVDNANDADSLVVAMNQIEIANHLATSIVMHPSDVTALLLVKVSATDKRYVDRLIMIGSTLTLDGIPIIKNTGIAVGTFLVMDGNKAAKFNKGGMRIDVGLSGDDFIENMRTIIAEWRGLVRVKGNDTTAFVTGTFATTNAALETA